MGMKARAALGMALAWTSLAGASPLAAEEEGIRPGLSLGGRAMHFRPQDGDGDWHGGAQLRLHLSPVWAVEGSVDYRRERFGRDGSTRVDTYPVQASLLGYALPDGPVSPFVLAGAGWYFTRVWAPGDFERSSHRLGAHLGAGLQFLLGPSWSLDGTWRYVFLEGVRSRGADLLDKDFSDRGNMLTAALNYRF